MTSPRRALLPTFATLGLAASALAQADGWPLQAQVLLAPARHAAAEGFDPAPVCATFSVPLAEGWNVGLVGGRPALSVSGSPVWSFRTSGTEGRVQILKVGEGR